jgi:hypothetical protein
MLLVIPGNAVLRVFTITGVDQIILNFTSLEVALALADLKGSPALAESTKEPAERGLAASPDLSMFRPGRRGILGTVPW